MQGLNEVGVRGWVAPAKHLWHWHSEDAVGVSRVDLAPICQCAGGNMWHCGFWGTVEVHWVLCV
jgi:hypothetical protein